MDSCNKACLAHLFSNTLFIYSLLGSQGKINGQKFYIERK